MNVLIEATSMIAMMAIGVLFGAFVSALAITAAFWYLGAHFWKKLGGTRCE